MTIQANSYLKIAVIYVLVGMVLGMQMGATENFKFTPVHAHLNLVGWVSMAIYGLAFKSFPTMAEGQGMSIHFWVANAGAVVLNIGIAAILMEASMAIPLVMTGEILTVGAMILFAVLVYRKT